MVVTLTVCLHPRAGTGRLLSFASLVLLGLWAYHFPKIGVEFMPPLDEGTVMDMPITVPRASVTEAADDLKARDALLRQFPEVESVIGKAGRADTPTDPAPLDMVETFVNFRPKELWPKRVLKFEDAARQTRAVLAALEERGYLQPAGECRRPRRAHQRRDHERAGAVRRDHARAGPAALPRVRPRPGPGADALRRGRDASRRFHAAELSTGQQASSEEAEIDRLAEELAPEYGRWLAKNPALEDVTRLTPGGAPRRARPEERCRRWTGRPPPPWPCKQNRRCARSLGQVAEVAGGGAQDLRRRGAPGA